MQDMHFFSEKQLKTVVFNKSAVLVPLKREILDFNKEFFKDLVTWTEPLFTSSK